MSHRCCCQPSSREGAEDRAIPPGRDIEKVERDALEGYVSIEVAQRDYGVRLDPDTREADQANTEESREKLS